MAHHTSKHSILRLIQKQKTLIYKKPIYKVVAISTYTKPPSITPTATLKLDTA